MDLPGALLHAENEREVMKMEGKLAELMVKMEPRIYRKYTTWENGKPALYVKLHKALYGLLESALLFYKKLLNVLRSVGFKVNKYDPCVANKIVDGSQMTVTWHVDDLKVSHKNKKRVDEFEAWLRSIYGNVKSQRGKHVDYLGIILDYSEKGKLKVSIKDYLAKTMEEFPEKITKTATTPATENLYRVQDGKDVRLLSVAQLLFMSSQARRDIQTAVAFLTT